MLLALLDWPVAQLMTLSMALVGNFDTVARRVAGRRRRRVRAWTATSSAPPARASVRSELAEEAAGLRRGGRRAGERARRRQLGRLPELRDAMSLVWRILLVWLAVLALFVIAGWVS